MKATELHTSNNIDIKKLLTQITDNKAFIKCLKDKSINLIKSRKIYVNNDRSRTVFTYINGIDFTEGLRLWFMSCDCYEGSISQKDLFEYLQIDLKNGFSITQDAKEIYTSLSSN